MTEWQNGSVNGSVGDRVAVAQARPMTYTRQPGARRRWEFKLLDGEVRFPLSYSIFSLIPPYNSLYNNKTE